MEQVQTITIDGMTCAACVTRVERVLKRVPGVTGAEVNLLAGTALIHGADVRFDTLAAAVTKAGYEAARPMPSSETVAGPDWWPVILAALLTAPLLASMVTMAWNGAMLPDPVAATLAGVVQIWCGRSLTGSAIKALRHGAWGMDLLVALGTWAAFLLSLVQMTRGGPVYFESAALVITLVLLGRNLEQRARVETGAALRALSRLRPETALVRRAEGEIEIPTDHLRKGDTVILLSGARAPVDGAVIEGAGEMDESLLTGESLPVAKQRGDAVMTGAINGSARLVITAQALAGETTLAQMVRLVEAAQSAKPAVQRLADRVSAVFIPTVLGIACATLAIWLWLGADPSEALINAVSVLVIACPCALGLATPAAIMAGTGVAARHGILIRDPAVLERISHIRSMVFDKTGTLTEGHPGLVAQSTATVVDLSHALQCAASLAAGSAHPLSRAVVESAMHTGLTLLSATSLTDQPGQGVTGNIEGQMLRLGRAAPPTGALAATAAEWQTKGLSLSWLTELSPTPRPLALLGFQDRTRPGAASAVAGLIAQGLRVVLLSGDNEGSVARIAQEVGITATHAGMTPQGKLDVIATLQQSGGVAMVGDGINDAPALAAADIGIAMGGGTDVARQAAGITLMRGDLSLVADALDIGARIQSTLWQGLAWAFVFNIIGIPLAAAGRLSPMLAGGAMAFSSLAVVLNALRLRRWRGRT